MLLLVSSLLLCACASGLAVRENVAAPAPIVVYKSYADTGRYAVVDVPMNWVDAAEVCRSFYGHLAFPETAEELAVLKSIMDHIGTLYQIGFHDQFKEGIYVSMKYQKLSDLDYNLTWAPGQPNGSLSQNCGGLGADGFYDFDCVDKRQFICEEDDQLGEGEFLDYEQIGPYGLFKMMEVNATWPEAVETCQDQGSHLWIINSATEYSAVFDHYNTTLSFWTGIHHVYADHFFVTIFDEKLEKTGFSTWSPGEPSGTNTQYPYVSITKNGMKLLATDRFFICEYNQPF